MPKGPEQYTPPEAEKNVSMRHILTYENPKIAEWQTLINHFVDNARAPNQSRTAHWGGIFFGKTFFSEYESHSVFGPEPAFDERESPHGKQIHAFLKEKLTEGMLVDLGGGGEGAIVMRAIARKCDAKTYISVDIGGPDFKQWPPLYDYVPPYEKLIKQYRRWDPYIGRRFKPLPQGDYLSPEDRTKPMDEYMVTSDMLDFVARLPDNSSNFVANGIDFFGSYEEGHDYRENLCREIIRTMRPGGVLFGISQEIGMFLLHKYGEQVRDRSSEFGYGDQTIVEKVK